MHGLDPGLWGTACVNGASVVSDEECGQHGFLSGVKGCREAVDY
jgi:hypothetical protein